MSSFSVSDHRESEAAPRFSNTPVQPKLKIGDPNDKYEQEADATADRVVGRINGQSQSGGPVQMPTAPGIQRMENEPKIQRMDEMDEMPKLQRECADCPEAGIQRMKSNEDDTLQRKIHSEEDEADGLVQTKAKAPGGIQRSADGAMSATAQTSAKINAVKGSGDQMDKSTKGQMESGFGKDFSDVNIHTDSKAAELSEEVGAKAFTSGKDIFFNSGEYNPQSKDGQTLLAHELTHTVQQGGQSALVQRSRLRDHKGEDPASLTDEEIKATNEYKSFTDSNSVWQLDLSVSEQEALMAARLMLRAINRDETGIWNNARDYLFGARRRIGSGVEFPAQREDGSLVEYMQTFGSYENSLTERGEFYADTWLPGMAKVLVLGADYNAIDEALYDQETIRYVLGPHADAVIEEAITKQVDFIAKRYSELQDQELAGNDPAGVQPWIAESNINDPDYVEWKWAFYGIPKMGLDAVYRASLNSSESPELLLALWMKEGGAGKSANTVKEGYPVSTFSGWTKDEMQNYVRSQIYFDDFGSDHFTAYIKNDEGDNDMNPEPGPHGPAFLEAVEGMKASGDLRRDFSVEEVTNEIIVVEPENDEDINYTVKPTARFYALSLELNSAYFNYLRRNEYDIMEGEPMSDVMNYAQWNMGPERFEKYMLGDENVTKGATGKELENALFHQSTSSEGQSRRNAIRFGLYLQSYELLFNPE